MQSEYKEGHTYLLENGRTFKIYKIKEYYYVNGTVEETILRGFLDDSMMETRMVVTSSYLRNSIDLGINPNLDTVKVLYGQKTRV